MQYCTYAFYTATYGGTVIASETEFNHYELLARAIIDRLTYCQVPGAFLEEPVAALLGDGVHLGSGLGLLLHEPLAEEPLLSVQLQVVRGRLPDNQIGQLTAQGITDDVKLFQAYTVSQLVVNVVDCGGTDAGYSGKVGLRPPPFAKAGGEQNSNHSHNSFAKMIA